MTDTERRLRVIDVVSQLHLTNCKKTAIRQLSGGERKRLAFAAALLTNPNVLLIDEPTSGLDTYLAKNLMEIIQSTAVTYNQTIVVVLHQPSSVILDVVHKLYLLVEGGQQAFYGSKSEAEEFFRINCQLTASSLDGFIEQVSAPADLADDQGVVTQRKAVEQYILSGKGKSLETIIEDYVITSIENNELNVIEYSSFLRQLKWLLWRSFASIKRNPKRTIVLVFRVVLLVSVFGILFFHLTPKMNDYIQNINVLLILLLLPLNDLNMSHVLVEVPTERQVVIWEYRRHMYSIGTYYFTRLIIDTIYQIILSIISISILSLLTNLSHVFAFIGIFILSEMTACGLGYLIAAISSTPSTGLLCLQPIQTMIIIFTGFFINLNSIPVPLRWLKYIAYLYYSYSLLLTVQWHNFPNPMSINATAGDDVLQCFDISYRDTTVNVVMHFVLAFVFHCFAFIITLFRIRRAA